VAQTSEQQIITCGYIWCIILRILSRYSICCTLCSTIPDSKSVESESSEVHKSRSRIGRPHRGQSHLTESDSNSNPGLQVGSNLSSKKRSTTVCNTNTAIKIAENDGRLKTILTRPRPRFQPRSGRTLDPRSPLSSLGWVWQQRQVHS
jgi:hypothetical protein